MVSATAVVADDVLEEERLAAAGLFHHPVGDLAELEVRAHGVGDAREFSRFVQERR